MRAWRRTCTIETPAAACHRVLSVVTADGTVTWTFDAVVTGVIDPGVLRVDGVNVVDLLGLDGNAVTLSYDDTVSPGMTWIVDAGPGVTFGDGNPACPGQSGLVT